MAHASNAPKLHNISELSMGEFVECLILVMKRNRMELRLRDLKPWNLLFYKLKQLPNANGKPKFFEKLAFDWDGPYPTSCRLAMFLRSLCWTGSIIISSQICEKYSLPDDIEKLWLRKFKAVNKETKKFINTAFLLAEEEFKESV